MNIVAEALNMQEHSGLVPLIMQIFSNSDNNTLKALKSVSKNFKNLVSLDTIRSVQFENINKEIKNLEIEQVETEKGIESTLKSIEELVIKQLSGPLKSECIKSYYLLLQKNNVDSVTKREIQVHIINRKVILQKETSRIKMTKGLLGNRYKDLPILDQKEYRTIFFGCVELEWMTAPIMRGQDADGRSFIAIRARDKKTQTLSVQTFFPLVYSSASWVGYGTPIVSYLIAESSMKVVRYGKRPIMH